MNNSTCHIYLVRHGATQHNLLVPPRMQGCHIDEPLAPLGKQQAVDTAKSLREKPITALYTSPLRRAMETARPIAERHGLVPIEIADLTEADVGRWEDRGWKEIAENDAEAYAAFRDDPVASGYPEGENLGEVTSRVLKAMDQITQKHPDEQIVVVAHSVVNRLCLGELLGLPVPLRRRVPQDNCGISQLVYQGDKRWVVTINAKEHLASNQTPILSGDNKPLL